MDAKQCNQRLCAQGSVRNFVYCVKSKDCRNSYERIMDGISNIDDIGGMIVETMNYSHFRSGTHEHRTC